MTSKHYRPTLITERVTYKLNKDDVFSTGRLKCGSGKCDTGKIAKVENARVENTGVDSRGGKCRSKPHGTPKGDYVEKP